MSIALREIFAEFGVRFDPKRELEKGERATQKATRGLSRLGEGAKKAEKATDAFGNSTKGSTELLKRFGAVLGGAAIIAGFRELVNSTIESTREIDLWSQRLGMSVVDMNSWIQTAALFGGSTDDITDALKELQLKARDAMTGTQSYIDAFKLLGLNVRDLAPVVNDQNRLMNLFTDALNRNTSAATQNFVVDELMSDAGTRLLPMFRAGTSEIRRLREQSAVLGGRNMPRLVEVTREYTRAERELNQTYTDTKNVLMTQIIPYLTAGVRKLRDWIVAGRQIVENSRLMRASMVVFGSVAVAAATAAVAVWGPAILTFAGVAAAIAAAVLIMDDLIVTFADDGDTVTKTFLEWALGARGAADAILGIRTAIEDVRDAMGWFDEFFLNRDYRTGRRAETQLDEQGNIQVTNPWSFIARQVQAISGENRYQELGNAQQIISTDEVRRNQEIGRRVLEEQAVRLNNRWGILDEPEMASPDFSNQSITAEDRAIVLRSAAEERDRVRRERFSAAMPYTSPRRTNAPSVSITAPMTMSVTVNEATDGDVITQRVNQAASAATREMLDQIGRGASGILVNDNEMSIPED